MVGIDIVKIDRIKNLNFNSFLNKCFTDREIEYINLSKNAYETAGGIYAVKEAVLKLSGKGILNGVTFKEIEVLHGDNKKPYLFSTNYINILLAEMNLNSIEISISHDGEYAVAVAMGVKK